jgi:hypothetical protein
MATNAEISAKVTEATSLALTPAQMVSLCDRAMGDYLSGRPMSYGIAGRNFVFTSAQQIKEIRDYYSTAPIAGDDQYICQPAEL